MCKSLAPRSYLGTALLVTVYVTLPSGLGFGALVGLVKGLTMQQAAYLGLKFGVTFGPSLGLVMGVFFRGVTRKIPVHDPSTFLSNTNAVLAHLGYRFVSQQGSWHVYQPTIYAGLLAGDLCVDVHTTTATLIGPWWYVAMLRRRLA